LVYGRIEGFFVGLPLVKLHCQLGRTCPFRTSPRSSECSCADGCRSCDAPNCI
jgi:hypothetical protein